MPVTVNIGERRLHLRTANLSAVGARVRVREAVEVGTSAQLHFECPELDVEATVSRADADGLVFAFNRALDHAAAVALRSGESSLRPD